MKILDQAVMSLKASSNKVDEHTIRMEAPTLSSRRGGYHVQGHDDVKSSEARRCTIRLPGGAARPSHDDVKSFEESNEDEHVARGDPVRGSPQDPPTRRLI